MFDRLINFNFRSGYEYEVQVCSLLTRLGFTATRTGNDDRGVDIVAQAPTIGKPKFYIQCKYYNKSVGLEAIQQVYTGTALRGNDAHPVVVTSSNITFGARELANQLGVEIISYSEWMALSLGYEKKTIIRKDSYGLMGILSGLSINDTTHAMKSSNLLCSNKSTILPQQTPLTDEKEQKKQFIARLYAEAKAEEEEISILNQQKSQHKQRLLDIQKEAMILALEYG